MSLLRKLLRLPRTTDATTEGLKAYQLSRAYERVFLDPQGHLHADARIVMSDLYQQAGIVVPTPYRKADGSISIEDTLINEGKRIMVLGLMKRIFKKKSLMEDGLSAEEEDTIAQTLIEELKET